MSVWNLLGKLQQIKDNEPKIYESGYNKGFAEGKVEGGGGIDTSDATATANDILYPCTAYVDGEKIEGNIMPKYESDIVVTEIAATIPSGYYPEEMRIVFPGEDPASVHNALNKLLADQESYLPEILSFTFEDANGVSYSLEFEKGMTWGEWCESFYNTVGMYINTDEGSQVLYWGVSTVVKLIDPENVITASELIEAERTYKAV
jgi:hypothetical protein